MASLDPKKQKLCVKCDAWYEAQRRKCAKCGQSLPTLVAMASIWKTLAPPPVGKRDASQLDENSQSAAKRARSDEAAMFAMQQHHAYQQQQLLQQQLLSALGLFQPAMQLGMNGMMDPANFHQQLLQPMHPQPLDPMVMPALQPQMPSPMLQNMPSVLDTVAAPTSSSLEPAPTPVEQAHVSALVEQALPPVEPHPVHVEQVPVHASVESPSVHVEHVHAPVDSPSVHVEQKVHSAAEHHADHHAPVEHHQLPSDVAAQHHDGHHAPAELHFAPVSEAPEATANGAAEVAVVEGDTQPEGKDTE